MKFKFKITNNKFHEAVNLIQKNGGNVYTNGSFEIKGVEGKVHRNEEEEYIIINITDKPFLASWGMIENKLNEFFN